MTAMRLYRLLQVFISAVNEIIQALHNETMDSTEAVAKTEALAKKLLTDMGA